MGGGVPPGKKRFVVGGGCLPLSQVFSRSSMSIGTVYLRTGDITERVQCVERSFVISRAPARAISTSWKDISPVRRKEVK